MRPGKLAWGLAAVIGALIAAPAQGACVATATGVSFGGYDPQSAAPDDAVGSVTIECPTGRPNLFPVVSLSPGSSGDFNSREMRAAGTSLQYNLYTDATRVQVWGDGSAGTASVTVPVVSRWGSRSVYGRIPAGQLVTAGTYSDIIVVTVEY